MSSQTYFVKIRGRVLGPFPPNRLVQMVKQGQLSRVHQLSKDGDTWSRADKYPDLFSVENTQSNNESQAASQPARSAATVDVSSSNAPKSIGWHYGIAGDSAGPVSQSLIISMIKDQKLSSHDVLWNEAMEEWEEVQNLSDFAAYLPNTGGSINTAGSNADLSPGSAAASDLKQTAWTLKSQLPWLTFVCISMYVMSVCQFFGFLLLVIKGGQLDNSLMIGQGVSCLLYAVVTMVAGYFLNRFANDAKRFVKSKRISDLNLSLEWLRRFWILVSIVLIIFFFLVVVAGILLVSVSGVWF